MNQRLGRSQPDFRSSLSVATLKEPQSLAVTLLTGGGDQPYAFGLATSLIDKGAGIDLIGSNELDAPDFHGKPGVNFLNLRGDQAPNAPFLKKIGRVLIYYARLIRYAATAKPKIFHILWNNKFETFDRTFLMLYYRLFGKRILLTAHNVNAAVRDGNDTALNRLTLRIQYRLADHIFVHTEKMKDELSREQRVEKDRITVIPFGINNAVPNTDLTAIEARDRLGIRPGERTLLFFGNIARYKGLDYLTTAFRHLATRSDDYRLIIAGRPKDCEKYWNALRGEISDLVQANRILLKADYIPDEETEVYFKAADVLVLPYKHIYQSGVLFLGHSFGLPVLAADVGSLKDDIVEGGTGFVFQPEDPVDLARAIKNYFTSELYQNLETHRPNIRANAEERHSWDVVAQMTMGVYAGLVHQVVSDGSALRGRPDSPVNAKP